VKTESNAEKILVLKLVKLDHNLTHNYSVSVEFTNLLEMKSISVHQITEGIIIASGILFVPTVHHLGQLKLSVHLTLNAIALEPIRVAEPELLLILAFQTHLLILKFAMTKDGTESISQKVQLLLVLMKLTVFGELMEAPYVPMTFHVTKLIVAMNMLIVMMDKCALSTHLVEKLENALLWLK